MADKDSHHSSDGGGSHAGAGIAPQPIISCEVCRLNVRPRSDDIHVGAVIRSPWWFAGPGRVDPSRIVDVACGHADRGWITVGSQVTNASTEQRIRTGSTCRRTYLHPICVKSELSFPAEKLIGIPASSIACSVP